MKENEHKPELVRLIACEAALGGALLVLAGLVSTRIPEATCLILSIAAAPFVKIFSNDVWKRN